MGDDDTRRDADAGTHPSVTTGISLSADDEQLDAEQSPDEVLQTFDTFDDDTITHRQLRSALELAVIVAADADRHDVDPPKALRSLQGKRRLAAHELGRVRRALVAAPEFRAAVGTVADDVTDEIGRLWLQRPAAWQERVALLSRLEAEHQARLDAENAHKREQKRRESAERKRDRVAASADHTDGRVERLTQQVEALQRELTEHRETITALRDELTASRNEQRHAADRQRAAERRQQELEMELEAASQRASAAEMQRDELLARRASGDGALSGSAVTDVRRLADDMRRQADQLARLVSPPGETRQPLAIPGAIHDDPNAIAELFMRSGALIVIDGYNVAMLAWPEAPLADQRRRLLDVLDNVTRRYGTEIVVVFDGADVVGASADQRRFSRVRYSPAGITADDVIRDEVAAVPAARPVVVVTNDREIQRDVVRRGSNVLASDAFVGFGLR